MHFIVGTVRRFWGCTRWPACDGHVNANAHGDAMSDAASRESRSLRDFAHGVFDQLWIAENGKRPEMSRSKAYAWLASKMGLQEWEAHFSRFNDAQCRRAIECVEQFIQKRSARASKKRKRKEKHSEWALRSRRAAGRKIQRYDMDH